MFFMGLFLSEEWSICLLNCLERYMNWVFYGICIAFDEFVSE